MKNNNSFISAKCQRVEGLPGRIKVLSWGENPNSHGVRLCLGLKALETMKSETFAFKRVPLDFEHNTIPGSATWQKTNEPRKVAGFGDIEIIENDGAYLDNIEYTQEGRDAAEHFIDVSAGVVADKNGDVLFIPSVAVCRNGAVPGMIFKNVNLSAFVAGDITQSKDNNMTEEELTALKEALNLTPESTAADIMAAVSKIAEELAECKSKETEAEAKKAEAEATAAKAETDKMEALSARIDDLEKQSILTQATAEGKVLGLSASVIHGMSIEQLREHASNVKPTVPLSAITVTPKEEEKKITQQQRALAMACGLDPDKDLK